MDREDPRVKKWIDRFGGHAVSPEHVADRILRGVRRNRFLVYTSPDIRALYMFKRTMWWPYSVAMRQVNVLFTRALRPKASTQELVAAVGCGEFQSHTEQPDGAVQFELVQQIQCGGHDGLLVVARRRRAFESWCG